MERIPRFLRGGPATSSQPRRLPWWRRRRPWWRHKATDTAKPGQLSNETTRKLLRAHMVQAMSPLERSRQCRE